MRKLLLLLSSFTALAQQPSTQDPWDAATSAYWKANSNFQVREAAAAREQARAAFDRTPVTSPHFSERAIGLARFYQEASLNSQARAILSDAIASTAPLGKSHPARVALLTALAGFRERDGNLLQAVASLEQAIAAGTAGPSAAKAVFRGNSYPENLMQLSIHLASLYQRLGRPDAAVVLEVKIRAMGATDPWALASFDEQSGHLDQAAAIYQNLAQQTTEGQDPVAALQALAHVQANQRHFGDAVATMQRAISLVPSASFANTFWMNQRLAGYLREAGLLDQADRVFRQLVQQSRGTPQEIQTLFEYAQYFSQTDRAAQAQTLLREYLENNPNLVPSQRAGILYDLANFSGQLGDPKAADQYRHQANALQPPPAPEPVGSIRIAGIFDEAQIAVNEGRFADAFRLAMDGIDTADGAVDGQQVTWRTSAIAGVLAARTETGKADQLYARLFSVVQNWTPYTMQPLIATAQNYVLFLEGQPDRLNDVPVAIESYRRTLLEANGPDSASLADPLRLRLQFERTHSQWPRADASARELLELQESLSGNTSEPYLQDLETAARAYAAAADYARSVPLYRKAMDLIDLLAPNDATPRSHIRLEAAQMLACAAQPDDAQMLLDAVAATQPGLLLPRIAAPGSSACPPNVFAFRGERISYFSPVMR